MKIKNTSNLVLVFILFIISPVLHADTDDAPTLKDIAEKEKSEEQVIKELTQAKVAGPYDEYNRSTPRSSLLSMAQAIKQEDYERAVNYLDLRNLSFNLDEEVDGPELVRKLVIVARRGMVIDMSSLSDNPKGHKDDGLPGYRDRITTMQTKSGPVDILMQRVPRGDGEYVWKISNATVSRIPELNKEFGYGLVGDQLSTMFPSYTIKGFELWQIVMLLLLLLASYMAAFILTWVVVFLLQKNQRFNHERLNKFIVGPLRFLIMVLVFRASFDLIAPSLVARALFEAKTLLVIAITWIMLGLVELIKMRVADRMMKTGQENAVVLLKPASTGIKLIVVLLAAIVWLDNMGYEVTTILAGLGVGGVAVALAAQKSLENLIGSITIYASQPVHVGDFCKFDNVIGTVEEIGLRSTQLRTLGRTVVHIPNALFSSGKIENLTQRDKILYRTRLCLPYEVKPEQLRKVLEDLRSYIFANEKIDDEVSRVRFIEFGKYAQEIELFAYVKTQDFAEYLEVIEAINLGINDIVNAAETHLTVPVNKTYLEKNSEAVVSL